MGLVKNGLKILRRYKVRQRLGAARISCLSRLFLLSRQEWFPPAWMAVRRQGDLLLIGGRVTEDALLKAYSKGIYPLYTEPPVEWFSCDPRMVLFFEKARLDQKTRRVIRSGQYHATFDTAFEEVVRRCSDRNPTWLLPERIRIALALHKRGIAHSVEVWNREGTLAGGLFGVDCGGMFLSESAFFCESNAGKVADAYLNRHLQHWGYAFHDGGAYTPHLESLGFETIPRSDYISRLKKLAGRTARSGKWSVDEQLDISGWIPACPPCESE